MTVSTAEQLQSLAETRRKRRTLVSGIALDLQGLDPEESGLWERRLSKHYFDCGCSTGAAAMLSTVAAYLLLVVVRHPGFTGIAWRHLGWGFAVAALGAGIGKAVGLRRARRRLQAAIEELMLRLRARKASVERVSVSSQAVLGDRAGSPCSAHQDFGVSAELPH